MSARFSTIYLGILLLFGVLIIREGDRGTFDTPEELFALWLAANCRRQPESFSEPRPILLVEANNETRRDSWPLSLLDYAAFLRTAASLNPTLVALADLPDSHPPTSIELRALESAALTVSQLLILRPHNPSPPTVYTTEYPLLASNDQVEFADQLGTPRVHFLVETLPAIAAFGPCLVRDPVAAPSPPQAVPEVHLLFSTPSGLVPSFVLRSLLMANHIAPQEVVVKPKNRLLLANGRTISLGPNGKMPLPNPLTSGFRRIEFGDFLLALQDPTAPSHPQLAGIDGGVILFGNTDDESRGIFLANGERISNAELYAAAICQLYSARKEFQRIQWVSWLLLGLTAALFYKLRSMDRGVAMVFSILIGAAYPIVAIAFYEQASLTLPFVPAYAMIGFLLVSRFFFPSRVQRPHKPKRLHHTRHAPTLKIEKNNHPPKDYLR